jgi:hypothetical protein
MSAQWCAAASPSYLATLGASTKPSMLFKTLIHVNPNDRSVQNHAIQVVHGLNHGRAPTEPVHGNTTSQ